MDALPYDGEPLTLGRGTYVVPQLPLRTLKALVRLARALPEGSADGADALDAFGEVAEPFADLLFASLRRNYPDLPRAVVDDGLTLPVFLVALPLVLRVNGLTQPEGGPGNAGAPQPTSTGAPSTPA